MIKQCTKELIDNTMVEVVEQDITTTQFTIGSNTFVVDLENAEALQIINSALNELKYNDAVYVKVNRTCRRPVVQYDIYGKFIAEYESIQAAAKELFPDNKIAHTNIQKCCAGKIFSAYKYVWQYK